MARHRAIIRTLALWRTLQRGKHSLYDLGDRFGVDARTIRRDIGVLRQIGVPIRHETPRRIGQVGVWSAESR